MLKEVNAVIGAKPLSADEIQKIKDNDIRAMPGEYQTDEAVLGAMQGIALYGRPDDYVQTLKSRIESQSDQAVQAAAVEVIKPKHLTRVIVGDLSKIEAPIRALNIGALQVLDSNGSPVVTPPSK